MIKLTIPGDPMGKQRPKFGNGRTYTPEKTVNYETLVKQLYISEHYGKQLEGPVSMTVRAYFTIPKSTPKNKAFDMWDGKIRPTKKPDCDNILKIICDALNGLAYRDDAQIVEAKAEKWYSMEPRVEVELEGVMMDG